tara:strand:- start:1010 stop:1213 length:204 start_codon:yes stop_codon:yes gene_type:complete
MCSGSQPRSLPQPRPTAPVPEKRAKGVTKAKKKVTVTNNTEPTRSTGGTSSLQIRNLTSRTGPNLNI